MSNMKSLELFFLCLLYWVSRKRWGTGYGERASLFLSRGWNPCTVAWWPAILGASPASLEKLSVPGSRQQGELPHLQIHFLSPCVPAASWASSTSSQPLALAAEKENSQVSIPRGAVWRRGCSRTSMFAEKFNYCLSPGRRFCFHSASLSSAPVLVTSRSVSTKAQVWRMGRWCQPRGFQSSPRRRMQTLCFLLPCFIHLCWKFLRLQNGPNLGLNGRGCIHSLNSY